MIRGFISKVQLKICRWMRAKVMIIRPTRAQSLVKTARDADEIPRHKVTIGSAFWISHTETEL